MDAEEIRQQIRTLTEHVRGVAFQQNAEELAGLIRYLLPFRPKRYLEIGAGCGNVARVLDAFFHFDSVHLIDDGQHWHGRLEQVPNAIEWIGDSTSSEAIAAIDVWGQRFDLIFIDADHAYESVQSDTQLALRCAADECWFAFHDACHTEVRRWLDELLAGRIADLHHTQLFGRSDGLANLDLFQYQKGDAPCTE